jgi:integrase
LTRGAKNLAQQTEAKIAGEIDGRILQYDWKCKLRGLGQETRQRRMYLLKRLVKDGANLDVPETVETVLAVKDYGVATKWLMVNAYHSYCKLFKIEWEPIKVKYQPETPYIPTEEECKIFIAGLSKTCSIFCKILYETGARCGEACKIEWTDINEENGTIAINHPLKGSNARINRVSRECIELLKKLPRKYGKHVFNPNPRGLHGSFQRQRAKIADRLGKPQLRQIHFHTFRHVRATMAIHNCVPLFDVKEDLGHKCIANTEKYVHWNRKLFQEKNDRFNYSSASTDEDAGKLIETGWTFVCNNLGNGHMLFRKAK